MTTVFIVTPKYELDGGRPIWDGGEIPVPKSLEIRVDARTITSSYEEVEQYISDKISDMTGWLHNGFETQPNIINFFKKV